MTNNGRISYYLPMQMKPSEHSGLASGQTTPFRNVMHSFLYYKRIIKEVKIKENNAAHFSKQKKVEERSSSCNKRLNGAVPYVTLQWVGCVCYVARSLSWNACLITSENDS
jgi:hypothetical protein